MSTATSRMRKMMEIVKRDGCHCIECGAAGMFTIHHCLPKSEYKGADRNSPWNLVNMCAGCQVKVHKSPALLDKYRQIALARRPKDGVPWKPPETVTHIIMPETLGFLIERLVMIEYRLARIHPWMLKRPDKEEIEITKKYIEEMKRKFGAL